MGIRVLSEICNDQNVMGFVSVCKSDSGICGSRLRIAHQALGTYLGKLIANQEKNAADYAVVILMLAGLPFGLGIADGLEAVSKNIKIFFSTQEKEFLNEFSVKDYDRIILVDAVINSGDNILRLADKIALPDKIIFATNVLSCKALQRFEKLNFYTTRVSQNSFKGSLQRDVSNGKGPDTGERLFDSCFCET